MAVKVGINGVGRIGRTVLRIAAERPDEIELVGSICARQIWITWST